MIAFVLAFVVIPGLVGVLAATARCSTPGAQTLRLSAHRRVLVPVATAGLVPSAAGLLASVSDRVAQELPLTFQRHAQSISIAAIAALLSFLACYTTVLAHRFRHPERRALAAASALLVAFFPTVYWRSMRTVAASLTSDRLEGGVVLQTHPASCAAATLANVARRLIVPISEQHAAELLGTTVSGTSPGQIRYALDALGLWSRTVNRRTRCLDDLAPPAILFADHPETGRESHVVAYMARADDAYEVWDPLAGKVLWTRDHAASRWHGAGIECSRRQERR